MTNPFHAQPRIDRTEEGFVAYCGGDPPRFSFLVGQEDLKAGQIGDNLIFVTRGAPGPYTLQVIWLSLPEDAAQLPATEDAEVLTSHFRWEMDHQSQLHSDFEVPDGAGIYALPSGRVFLAGYTKFAEDEPDDGQGGEDRATPFTAYASMRDGPDLIMFSVQGLGAGWSPNALLLKAMRTACATFFHATATGD